MRPVSRQPVPLPGRPQTQGPGQRVGLRAQPLGQHPSLQVQRVDGGRDEGHPVDPPARGIEEADLDARVVREQDPPGQGPEQLGEDGDGQVTCRDRVVGQPVHGRRLPHVTPGRQDAATRTGQVDGQPVDGHPADREDAVLLDVQPGALDVESEQRQLGHRGGEIGEGSGQVVP